MERKPGRLTGEQYRLVYREGARYTDEVLVLYVRRSGLQVRRAGISVSRQVGCAVRRNREKRRVREAYRRQCAALPIGVDLVLLARANAVDATFSEIEASLQRVLAHAGLLERPREGA